MIKRVFTMENASQKERYEARKLRAIKKYQTHPFDTVSPAVQVAMMSERIFYLVMRFNQGKKRNK